MKVYILLECEQYEPDSIIGVYLTLELAYEASAAQAAYNEEMEIPDKYLRIVTTKVVTE